MLDPSDVTEEPVVAEARSLGETPPNDSAVDRDPVGVDAVAEKAAAPVVPVDPDSDDSVLEPEAVAESVVTVNPEPVVVAESEVVLDVEPVAVAEVSSELEEVRVDAAVILPTEESVAFPAHEDSAHAEPLAESAVGPAHSLPPIEVPGGTLPPIEEHAPLIMQILGGIVTGVTNREVDLTLDDGREAVIHRENFDLAGTDPTTVLQVGDGAEGAVLSREDPRNRVVLSRKWLLRDRAWKKATESIADHSMINCRVTAASKKGVVVDMMGLRGFVPLNHFQLSSQVPPPETVGQMVELRVLAADRQKDRLLLSRRSALMKEQRKADAEALQSLKVGDTYKGTVNELTAFGAFVTVNGVRGLLHVSEMSWDRVTSPKGLVQVGQEIDVQVIEVKPKKRRVSFSRKALLDDPMAGIEVGSVHTGTVKRLVDYGVFVDIGPAEGMVHLSELAEYRPHHPSEVVLRGDEVQVKVLKVNREKRRLELSVRQALYFPA